MAKQIIVTRRQLEVLLAMGQYGCTKHVADALDLSRHTVRAHLSVLRERTGKSSTLEMLQMYYDGLLVVEPEPPAQLPMRAAAREVFPLGQCVTYTHYPGEPKRLSLPARTAEEWLAEASGHRDGGRLWEALRANEAGRTAFPEDGELLLQAADLYQRDGQWGRARDGLEGLVGRLEGERWLWWRAKRALGLLYGMLGDRAHEAEVLGEIGAWVPAGLAA